MKSIKGKITINNEKILKSIMFAIFLIYAGTLIVPFLWIFLNSFKQPNEFYADIWSLPKKLLFDNYIDIFVLQYKKSNIILMTFNSLLIIAVSITVGLMIQTSLAYVVAKYRFKLKGLIFLMGMVVMVVPSIGTLPALYKLTKDIGFYDNYGGYLIMSLTGFGFNFLMMIAYFKSVSWNYAEAAMIDGANDLKIFCYIMLPQALPTLVSLAILTAINKWNDYFTPYMFLPSHPPLAVGLRYLIKALERVSAYPKIFSIMIISMLPMLVVFSVFQKKIIENTIAGGLKG